MAVSVVFVLDQTGKVLISRDYRGDIPLSIVEKFQKILQSGFEDDDVDAGGVKPCVVEDGTSFMYIKHSNLYLMAASRQNVNAAAILLFLYKLVAVFQHYFKTVEEESIRDNFVIVYELLDEVMDNGFPQFTEAQILSEYIKTGANELEVAIKPPMAVTNAVSWRGEGIKYKKNEVFLDVVESVNLLVSNSGNVLRSEINGALRMRVQLSGMPECKLGLNDKLQLEGSNAHDGGQQRAAVKAVELDDVKFHQCVRLARFDTERTISFVPPDGEFDLMTYRLNRDVKPLIWVEAHFESHSRSRVEMLVKCKSQFKARSTAVNVEIAIPVSSDAITPEFKTNTGKIVYAPERECLLWHIKNLPGAREFVLRARFGLPSVAAERGPEKRPITVRFEIPYFTVSGLQVRHLKIFEKSGYNALPWVRYITVNGDYNIRTAPQTAPQGRASGS